MNAQLNIQNFNSSKSSLYTVTENGGQFDTSAHQSTTGIKMHPAAGQRIEFVARIRALIETNLDVETYGINQLCRDAGASRSQIHNKLKKWTGLSTTFYIRSIKLEKAKYFLVQTDLNITQVAYEVGFSDPSYFSRVFDQSFGICPKNFRKRWQKTYSAA